MACGCPVVSSDSTSLPEVVGDAGILVNPEDGEALTGAMEKMLSDDAFRRECVDKGLTRAGRFTWESSARTLADLLQTIGREG